MKNIVRISTLLLFVFVSISAGYSLAIAEEDAPIHISADHMTSTEKNSSVVFTGDVDAKQDDVRIRTDQMTVHYTKNENDGKQQVDKLVCVGNVEVTRGEWLGTGKRMTYLALKKQVILTGNAKAWQDQNMVSGSEIIYYLDEGRSEVIGGKPATSGNNGQGSGRVNMTIIQK